MAKTFKTAFLALAVIGSAAPAFAQDAMTKHDSMKKDDSMMKHDSMSKDGSMSKHDSMSKDGSMSKHDAMEKDKMSK